MSVQQPSVPAADNPFRRLRWLFWAVALAIGILAGVLVGALRGSSSSGPQAIPTAVAPARPAATWAAGTKPAPDFRLTDQAGEPVSLARFRGRPVIVTFIDPLCRNLCPTEAKILDAVVAKSLPGRRPAVVAVSVNQWGNARHVLVQDVRKWNLPAEWHWAVGAGPALKRVWAAYQIGVTDSPKKVTGVVVHNISHTEASFLV
ncbi:MAG TPA: SCO family protein, partial [Gaiellaceae bacterium]|nr:SCO family protein [Gaiellaceae bacterium]